MADTNTVTLYGRLVRDTELAYLPKTKTPVCEFSVANNRKWGDKEHVLYMLCKVFGKQAETCNQYLAKGRAVTVTGRLQQENWEKDGQKRSKIVLIASEVQFIGGREDGQAKLEAPAAPLPEPTPDFDDSDCPF